MISLYVHEGSFIGVARRGGIELPAFYTIDYAAEKGGRLAGRVEVCLQAIKSTCAKSLQGRKREGLCGAKSEV